MNDIYTKLLLYDEQENSDYARNFNKRKYKGEVIKALRKIGDTSKTLTEPNYNRILRSYDVLKRKISGTTSIRRIAKDPSAYSTKDIQINTISLTELKKDHAIIFDISSVKKSLEDDRKMMNEAYQELPRKNVIEVKNTYFFKCPLNTVILSHTNEIDFTRNLIDKRYVNKISAWIKVSDKGFYDIPYSYRKGIHQKEAKFNPDFFIKIGKAIVVVEIKSDDDVNIINKAKLKFAERHFQELNRMNLSQKYYFKFLTPKDYSSFFGSILDNTYPKYTSDLMAELNLEAV